MKDSWKYIALITQIGLTIAFTIFLFTILGGILRSIAEHKGGFYTYFSARGLFWRHLDRLSTANENHAQEFGGEKQCLTN